MRTILFVNACVRGNEMSRTYRLAQSYLCEYVKQHPQSRVKELDLEQMQLEVIGRQLITKREHLTAAGELTDPMFDLAKEFADADLIVIAAPHWDLGFPAILKIYLEHICVAGITFHYTESGSEGLAKASGLIYITTRGGDYEDRGEELDLGYVYVKHLGEMLGITECRMLCAQGLDIIGNDAEAIMDEAVSLAKEAAESISE